MSQVSLLAPLLEHARTRPEHIAVRGPRADQRTSLTYRQFVGAIAARTRELQASGLRPGERVGLIAPTCPEFLIEFLAVEACGAITVCLNPLSTVPELDFVLSDSGASHLIMHPLCPEAGSAAAEALGIAAELLTPIDMDALPAASPDFSPVTRGPEDCVLLLYTSGTTGRPKGAMLSARTLLTGVTAAETVAGLSPADRAGTALPLFHVFGLGSVAYPVLANGAAITLLPRFDADELLETIIADELTIVAGVPTMWNALTHATAGEGVTTPQLRLALSGGAAISLELMRAFHARFGASITEGYGLTETCAFGTFNAGEGEDKIGSVGLPAPTMEVRIVDPATGEACGPGQTGEVRLRGPLVMLGYWNRPEATAEAFDADGFFCTGDLGHVDEDGYLYIVDRLKDLIIHGGYNVYPREVEEVLYAHPQVFEAAVIGAADEHYGQQVAAVVTPMPGTELTGDEIEAWCRQSLSAYKIPRIIRIVDGLPKGPTGKIRKRSIEL
ncbi:class I adenylate-forming enzyme family protein [Brevibacterium luteolum]|uniref:class I adenylate-forming enzyme family protein n=1 Tax=Brevibacterium luteolum TaxID=199591 RepID=UPI003EEFAEA7